ncbi:helix-turn-helix protein [Nitrospirillum amazonense]|uniref:Helix-turn-helix protein n=1 Tax=Nitrospirillum amazonense TaxID=28077 RepID=A0A560K148_9PROT|nr:helix-turn-helix domain-containing protein [Nitrospirillum amazonense]TWB75514.1 helix-turn-helix protein [Nitrospirillum amazonense]
MTRRRNSLEGAQGELFKARTTWFHVLHAMIENGECAALKPYATVVYLVVKAYANFRDGTAFPSVETIASKAGMSKRQVSSSLKVLIEAGYLVATTEGRRNKYKIKEKVELRDPAGMPAAVATWDYLPNTFMEALEQLRSMLAEGVRVPEMGRPVVIKNLNINVQINARDGVQTAQVGSDGAE